MLPAIEPARPAPPKHTHTTTRNNAPPMDPPLQVIATDPKGPSWSTPQAAGAPLECGLLGAIYPGPPSAKKREPAGGGGGRICGEHFKCYGRLVWARGDPNPPHTRPWAFCVRIYRPFSLHVQLFYLPRDLPGFSGQMGDMGWPTFLCLSPIRNRPER